MNTPLYLSCNPPARLPNDGHRGLWYERFFNEYTEDFTKLASNEESKKRWIDSVINLPAGDKNAIEQATDRLQSLCEKLGGKTQVFAADWHFVTGLGNPHPVENGFLWHPTLGVPYLPGSAIKGLVRALIEAWMEFESEDERHATLYRWFGSEDKKPEKRKELRLGGFIPPSRGQNCDTEAGTFIFFDALPIEPVTLKADIMTLHMGKWYEKGGEDQDPIDPDVTPADWHNPLPVLFLIADKPKFQFSIAPRFVADKGDVEKIMAALEDALDWLGAGAKTSVGYGRMVNLRSMAQKWLDNIMDELRHDKDFKGQPEETLWKKALSEKYLLASTEIQKEVLPLVQEKWKELKINWNDPKGNSAQAAKNNFSK